MKGYYMDTFKTLDGSQVFAETIRYIYLRLMHECRFPIPFILTFHCVYIYFLKELVHCAVGIIFEILGLLSLILAIIGSCNANKMLGKIKLA